ncbi:MAG TPA: GNAT family N-acetyltransferase [Herpetosiphonaceae bacterium]
MQQFKITIRPCAEHDLEAIAALVKASWSHDATISTIYKQSHRVWPSSGLIRHTLVATVDDSLVGVGTLFESTIHPRMLFVTLNVAPGWQRRGIGSQIWSALEALGDRRPWIAKMTRRDQAGMSFLQKRSFKPLVSTLHGLLDPAATAVQAWIASLPQAAPNYRIINFEDAPATREEVALVHAAIYRQAHEWNPPIEESVDGALAHYCGPNVLAGSQLCVYRGQQLVGAANLIVHPFEPESGEAYLVNLGVVDLPTADADTLTGALIRRSLSFAAARGLRVRFEADDPHQPFQSWLLHAPATEVDHEFTIMGNA